MIRRYKYNKNIIDKGWPQVHFSSQDNDIGMDDIGIDDIGMGAQSKGAGDHTGTSASEDLTKIGMGEMIRRRIAEQHAQFYGWENDTHE